MGVLIINSSNILFWFTTMRIGVLGEGRLGVKGEVILSRDSVFKIFYLPKIKKVNWGV